MRQIADYVVDYRVDSAEAYDIARYRVLDSLACALLATEFPECALPGSGGPRGDHARGSPGPGTAHELDPVQAAFGIGTQIHWLDFNDTWLVAE